MNQVEEVANTFSSAEMRKKEADFDKLALEIFSNYRLYEYVDLIAPYCLVRILPKDMMVGNIIIPHRKETNKPVWEGIVLRTWEHRLIPFGSKVRAKWFRDHEHAPDKYEISSELSPGDHVLFPHFAGQPIPGLDPDVYRAIPEGINKNTGLFMFGNDVGVIFAKVDYQRESVEEVFDKVLEDSLKLCDRQKVRFLADTLLTKIREEFDISVKVKGSKTLSGS